MELCWPPPRKRSAKRAWAEEACRWAAGKRQLMEGVIWQLKDLFGLERHRAKTPCGLLARLLAAKGPPTREARYSTLDWVARYATSPSSWSEQFRSSGLRGHLP